VLRGLQGSRGLKHSFEIISDPCVCVCVCVCAVGAGGTIGRVCFVK
jgi:hypothetical protein